MKSFLLLQDMMEGVGGTDSSGNPILGDIGKLFYDKVGGAMMHDYRLFT
jgi:hypothetical protein